MGVNLALNSALSGLLTSQQAMATVSNNLANVNNKDYNRKTVNLEERVVSGVGAGVQIASIQRTVDEGLIKTVRVAAGTQSQLQTNSSFYTSLQNLFGQPGDTSSISHLLQTMGTAFGTLATTPTGSASDAVGAASTALTQLQTMTTQIQDLRRQADQQVSDAVSQINTSLGNIAGLNDKISVLAASNVGTDDLRDQRDKELNTLSTYMDITSFSRSDETISLFTKQGTPLLDGVAATINHNGATIVQPWMNVASGTLTGVTANGVDITSQISSGKISALIDMRDNVLPNLQSQLDTLAQTMQQQVNQINNRGVSWPTGGQSFNGTRTFADPATQTMSLSGGDTAIVLLASDGTEQARTTVNTLMQSYLQSQGQPITSSFTAGQLATATNNWLNTQYNTVGITYASVTSSGNFSIQLPQTSTTTLAFRDQHTVSFDSSIASDNLTSGAGGKALGASGSLTFRDSQGNAYTAAIAAGDSLADIQTKINALGGVTASLTPTDTSANPLYRLTVSNNAGLDMTVDPDSGAGNVVSKLGILPSRSQPAADVSVNYSADQRGSVFTSTSVASAAAAAGISGQLTFRDPTGTLASVTVTAGQSLTTIAANIAAASGGTLTATTIGTGNTFALQVTDAAGNPMTVDGTAQTYQSAPTAAFVPSAGKTLSVTVGGTTYGPLTETGVDTLNTIAASINSSIGPLAGSGVTASVETNGVNSWLSLVSKSGKPATFSGTMVAQLGITLNAATSLGLSPAPSEVDKGFSNFLGLNDLFVTNQPKTTIETKTLTNYLSTAAGSLNLSDSTWTNGDPANATAQALTLNFTAGQSLQTTAAQINAQAVTYDGVASVIGTFTAAAGTLTVSSNTAAIGSVTVNAGDSLRTIAANINAQAALTAGGVRAIVATDGKNEWLRLYDQKGTALTMSGTATGTTPGTLQFATKQMATAAVVNDGAGQRLRITHVSNSDMAATGTLVSQTGMGLAALNTANSLSVRADVQNNPSLISRGAILYNDLTNSYYTTAGDGTTIAQMATMMQTRLTIPNAGGVSQGSVTLGDYAASIIATNSVNAAANTNKLTYQNTLKSNLDLQKNNISGVNMDQEVSDLITYQQAYSASAKVISTMQTLFDVLDSLIK